MVAEAVSNIVEGNSISRVLTAAKDKIAKDKEGIGKMIY